MVFVYQPKEEHLLLLPETKTSSNVLKRLTSLYVVQRLRVYLSMQILLIMRSALPPKRRRTRKANQKRAKGLQTTKSNSFQQVVSIERMKVESNCTKEQPVMLASNM